MRALARDIKLEHNPMRTRIDPTSVFLWLSDRDTYEWAHKPDARWFCSSLSGKRLAAVFDDSGLVDLTVMGRSANIPADEFNAIVADSLKDKLPKDHPCYFVCVGQFTKG